MWQIGHSVNSLILVKVKVSRSCRTLQPHGLYSPWNSLGRNTGVGSLSLLQGIFPTQGSNPGLLHCRQILHQLSHKGSSALNADSLQSWWKPAAWQPPEGAEMGQASCRALFPDKVPRSLFVLSGSSLEDPLGWLSPTDLTQFEILFPDGIWQEHLEAQTECNNTLKGSYLVILRKYLVVYRKQNHLSDLICI